MFLETERLELHPLNAEELKKWVYDIPSLEKELNCTYQAEPMEGFFLEIVKGQLSVTEKEPENYLWHSFWFLIRKSDRKVVGSADFKAVPDENGVVEIGYGLGKEFEHNGYMTEAVKMMCDWAFKQENVRKIVAETDVDGFASQKILERCGFKKDSSDKTLWWSLSPVNS